MKLMPYWEFELYYEYEYIYIIIFLGVNVFGLWKHNFCWDILYTESWIFGRISLPSSGDGNKISLLLQGKNITWNIPVQWTGALKKLPAPLQKLHAQTFRFPGNMQVCVVGEIFNTERQKKVHARRTCTAKSYMPTVKINLPRAFGQCYVLALYY